jgi:hypothetical protein
MFTLNLRPWVLTWPPNRNSLIIQVSAPGRRWINWKTGKPNARYWVLKLLRDNFGPGDRLVSTVISSQDIYAQGFITLQGRRKILFVNKRDRAFVLTIPAGKGAHVEVVDQTTASGPARAADLTRNDLTLPGLAVAVVTLAK